MNELHDVTFLFSSHDDKVINRAKRIVWLRDGQVERIEISEEALRQGDKDLLEELVLAAVRDGIERANRLSSERLAKVTGGLNLPGLM